MRLIDADKFKQQIAAVIIRDNLVVEKGNAVCDLIDKQPTAYDVDKVIEQISILQDNAEYDPLNTYDEKVAYCTAYNRAIEKVRIGGM